MLLYLFQREENRRRVKEEAFFKGNPVKLLLTKVYVMYKRDSTIEKQFPF
jgi:hypothetical protein